MFNLFFDNINNYMKIFYFITFQIYIIICFINRKFIIKNYAIKYKFLKKLLIFLIVILINILVYNILYYKSINLILCIIINSIGQGTIWILAICLFIDKELLEILNKNK